MGLLLEMKVLCAALVLAVAVASDVNEDLTQKVLDNSVKFVAAERKDMKELGRLADHYMAETKVFMSQAAELKANQTALEQQNKELRKKVDQIRAVVKRLHEMREALAADKDALQGMLKSQGQIFADLKKERYTINGDAEDAAETAAKCQERVDVLAAQSKSLEHLPVELQRLNAETTDAKQALEDLKQRLAKTKDRGPALRPCAKLSALRAPARCRLLSAKSSAPNPPKVLKVKLVFAASNATNLWQAASRCLLGTSGRACVMRALPTTVPSLRAGEWATRMATSWALAPSTIRKRLTVSGSWALLAVAMSSLSTNAR